MKKELAKKLGFMGCGVGIVLFALFGLLHGSFLGGAVGLALVNYVFGSNTLVLIGNELLPRIVVAVSMITGVFVAATIFVLGGSLIGWLLGYGIGYLAEASTKEVTAVKKPIIK